MYFCLRHLTKSQSLRLEIITQYDHGIQGQTVQELIKKYFFWNGENPSLIQVLSFHSSQIILNFPKWLLNGSRAVGHKSEALRDLESQKRKGKEEGKSWTLPMTDELLDQVTEAKSVSHRLEFLVLNRASCWKKKNGGLLNKFLIDCCVCIQCVILKINSNNSKHPDWLVFTYILYKYCLTHFENCYSSPNGRLLYLWKFCDFFFFLLFPTESLRLIRLGI